MSKEPLYGMKIARKDLFELELIDIGDDISMSSLNQWIQYKTDKKYMIVPRDFVISLMDVIELTADANFSQAILHRYDFEKIRMHL